MCYQANSEGDIFLTIFDKSLNLQYCYLLIGMIFLYYLICKYIRYCLGAIIENGGEHITVYIYSKIFK